MHRIAFLSSSITLALLAGCSSPNDTSEASTGSENPAKQATPSEGQDQPREKGDVSLPDKQDKSGVTPVAADAGEGHSTVKPAAPGDWADGDTIPSGREGVPDIQILKVHKNGSGDPCGLGKSATLKYKAMLANGRVIDPGRAPFTFKVGSRGVIQGWHRVVSRMRVGDSFTILMPQDLAYGASKGDLKFDMELLSVK